METVLSEAFDRVKAHAEAVIAVIFAISMFWSRARDAFGKVVSAFRYVIGGAFYWVQRGTLSVLGLKHTADLITREQLTDTICEVRNNWIDVYINKHNDTIARLDNLSKMVAHITDISNRIEVIERKVAILSHKQDAYCELLPVEKRLESAEKAISLGANGETHALQKILLRKVDEKIKERAEYSGNIARKKSKPSLPNPDIKRKKNAD